MLEGKSAIVTGAGRGIGQAIALKLAREGAAVVATDLAEENAAETAQMIRDAGGAAVALKVDVTNEADAEAQVALAIERWGKLDILVNNAGTSCAKPFLETTKEDMERVIGVNLIGAFLCARVAAAHMVGRGAGRIINIASLSGQRGGWGRAAYGTAKAGLEVMSRIMAVELSAKGVLTNNVAPGAIATQMALEMHDQKTRDAYHRLIPQRRYGTPEEIADAVAFLASDQATHISGVTLNVDGGFWAAGLMFDD